MARMTSSNDLLDCKIVLNDGSTDVIFEVLSSGYKINSRARALPVRTVAKIGDKFYEVPSDIPSSDITNSKKGYIVFNDGDDGEEIIAQANAAPNAGKIAVASASNKPAASAPKASAGKKQTEKKSDKKTEPKATKKEQVEPKGTPVRLTEVQKEFATDLSARLMEAFARMAKVDKDGSPISNDAKFGYGVEFSSNAVQIVVNVQYDTELQVPMADKIRIDPKIVKAAAKRVTVNGYSKKLGRAIESAFSIDLEEFVVGIVLQKNKEDGEVVVCGESLKDTGKLVVYVVNSNSFRRISMSSLRAYKIVQEEADEDDYEEIEDEDEIESKAKPKAEPKATVKKEAKPKEEPREKAAPEINILVRPCESGYDEDCMTDSSTKLFSRLSRAFNGKVIQGSVFSDGTNEMSLLGIDENGSLLVETEGEAVEYEADDIEALLSNITPVTDEMDADFGTVSVEDMDDEELRLHAIEIGVVTSKKSKVMSRAKLLKLLGK